MKGEKKMEGMLELLFQGTQLEGADLKEARENAGFSLADVAAHCGVSEMTVRNFEAGKSTNFKIYKFYMDAFCKEGK